MRAILVLILCVLANASSKEEVRLKEVEDAAINLPDTESIPFIHGNEKSPQQERSPFPRDKVCKRALENSNGTDDGEDTADLMKCIRQGAAATGKVLLEKLIMQETQVTDLEGFKTFSLTLADIHSSLAKLMQTYSDQKQLVYNLNGVSNVFMSFDVKVSSEFMSVLNCTKRLPITTKTIIPQVSGAFLDAQLFSLDSLALYSYLPNLYETLSDYRIQSDKSIVFDFDPNNISFEKLQTKFNISVPLSVSIVNLNSVKQTNIFNILNATINHKTETYCSAFGPMEVIGSFVLLSEVVENVCFKGSNRIEIYAANRLYIDTDISKNGTHIAMASPVWDVQGKRLISVDGAKGLAKAQPIYESRPGYDGRNGEPGNAGYAGGEFFGIGQKFLNGEKLTISANGGNGGDGAEGGDAFNWNGIGDRSVPCYIQVYYWENGAAYHTPADCYGKNGGLGGVGGKPGPGGFVNLWDLEGNSVVAVKTSTGLTGTGGIGGKAGEIFIHVQEQWEDGNFFYAKADLKITGHQGVSNSNSDGIQDPPSPISRIFPSISSIVYFKRTLRKFESVALESQQREFLEKFEHDPATLALYNNSNAFIEEFEDLEEAFKFKEANSISFFESLLKRAQNFSCDDAKDGNCQDFRYMRLALMSIVAEGSDEYFVVNVHDYLELLLKQIQQYHTSIRELNIRQKNEDYVSDLLSEIIEARNFIANDVVAEINKATEEIESEMSELVEVVEQHLDDAEALKEELQNQKEKLKQLAAKNTFFSVAGFLSSIFSFIPGAGIIGAILGAGFNAGSTVVSDKIEEIKQSAIDAEGQIDTAFIRQQEFIKKYLLDELYAQVNSSQATSDDDHFVKLEIEQHRVALQGPSADFLRAKEKIQKEIADYKNNNGDKSVGFCVTIANDADAYDDENSSVERLEGIIDAAGDGFNNIYNAVGENNDAKTEIDNAIYATDEEIDALKSYESTIYNALIPMIEDLKVSMINATNQTDLSHVEIDVKTMTIDNALTDFKAQMDFMVQAFDDPTIKPTIMGCIDKLRSAMKTAMSIFDRIADFRDQAKLVNFITDIQLDNSAMTPRQIQYEILAKTYMITKEFDHGVRAFKQFSFPFASLYIDRFQVDQSVIESQNDSRILDAVSQQIDFLTDELVKDATVVRNEGYTIYPETYFDSSNKDQPPFYVWESLHNKVEISRLLEGKQVTLTAELSKEEAYANALKFKEVGIRFLSANQTVQSLLDDQMDDFQVTMTHLGSSYFQCADKKFVINHNKIKMTHAMNRVYGDYGQPDINTITLRNNPAMCSPYATWLMQISHKQGCEECISDLEKFVDEDLNLALEGDGQFIDIPDGKDICGDSADQYYQRVDEA